MFGQAILVSSRLGAYCGAAWRLLEGEGAKHADADKASPLSHFCDVLKLLIRQHIIQRMQVWPSLLQCTCIMPVHVPWDTVLNPPRAFLWPFVLHTPTSNLQLHAYLTT